MPQTEISSDQALHDLAQSIATIFAQRGATLVTAESCTGGWIAKTLTDIA
ncbi:MAG TPA: CinA family protein, partial [Rhodanobacteraceae bacterium]|nr:CinA family protein [Rhodanobacteraceae bacterium]